jgi:hypothetical protein
MWRGWTKPQNPQSWEHNLNQAHPKFGYSTSSWVHSLGAFAKLWKATMSFIKSICLSVHLSTWSNSSPIGLVCITLDIWIFIENSFRKFKFH